MQGERYVKHPTIMEKPSFLTSIQSYPGEIAQFVERIPGVDVTGDRDTVLERLEPYHREEVEALGWRWKDLRRAEQVHGTKAALVGDIGSNYPVGGADALICGGVSDCVLGIYVADCAAVWLYDKEFCHRALVHSGKAGTEGNIIANTIKSMKRFLHVKPENLIAVISPCIRPPHYEMDIPATIKAQLLAEGVQAENIHDSNLDTASDLTRFYSYRMEKGQTGRMLALFGPDHATRPHPIIL